MKKQKTLKSNNVMTSPNSNLMQESDRKTEINNFHIVHNIYIENIGRSGKISSSSSLSLTKLHLSLISVLSYLLFDIDLEISFLSGTFISLIFYMLFNHAKDALFAFFS